MKKLISNCPALGTRSEFRGIMNLKGLDVIATRLWLDQSLPTKFPANVLAGFEPGVGGTYFNLSELQVSLALSAFALCALSALACDGCGQPLCAASTCPSEPLHIHVCVCIHSAISSLQLKLWLGRTVAMSCQPELQKGQACGCACRLGSAAHPHAFSPCTKQRLVLS